MYLLSNEEVQELFHQSVINLRNQAILFLKKIGVNEFSFSLLNDITRLFLLAKIYNAFDLIDETQLKTVLFDNNRLKTYISDFRLKAHHYQDSIRQIVLRGMTIRQINTPKFPSFFDQGNRVYLKINPVSSGMIFFSSAVQKICAAGCFT
jgi:hypothetical protein